MRYRGYYNCKICGKTWWHKSNHVPFELIDWFYYLLSFCHLIAHHRKELDFKKVMHGMYQILFHIVVAIMWVVMTTIQIVLFPFKMLIDLLY